MRTSAIILTMLVLPMVLALATPCYAALGGLGDYGLGAGVMFPDIEGIDTNNSIYYLFDVTSMDFLLEVNYVDDGDMNAWLIHGDYKYALTGIMATEAYLGFGYTYLFSDTDALKDANGINLCLGLDVQENIDVRGRYLFLGGGDHILTAGATIYF